MSRTPNYVLCAPFTYWVNNGRDTRTLPEGCFVRPIKLEYVPDHIRDKDGVLFFDPETHVYCYTHFGIVPIQRSIIREV